MTVIYMLVTNNQTIYTVVIFFQLNTDTRTRWHLLKLVKHRCHLEMRRHFFSERVINRWNKLDQVTISASAVNGFKSRLEKDTVQKMGLFMD